MSSGAGQGGEAGQGKAKDSVPPRPPPSKEQLDLALALRLSQQTFHEEQRKRRSLPSGLNMIDEWVRVMDLSDGLGGGSAGGGGSGAGDLMGFESRAPLEKEEKLQALLELNSGRSPSAAALAAVGGGGAGLSHSASAAGFPRCAPVRRSQTDFNLSASLTRKTSAPQGLAQSLLPAPPSKTRPAILAPPAQPAGGPAAPTSARGPSCPPTPATPAPTLVSGGGEPRRWSSSSGWASQTSGDWAPLRWRLPSGSSEGRLPVNLPFRLSGLPSGDLIDLSDPESIQPCKDAWVEFDPLAKPPAPDAQQQRSLHALRQQAALQLENPVFGAAAEEEEMGRLTRQTSAPSKGAMLGTEGGAGPEELLRVLPSTSTAFSAQLSSLAQAVAAELATALPVWATVVLSPKVGYPRRLQQNVKVVVTLDGQLSRASPPPALNLDASLDSEVYQVLVSAALDLLPSETSEPYAHALQVEGTSEFLDHDPQGGGAQLRDFVCVHQSFSRAQDIRLVLTRFPKPLRAAGGGQTSLVSTTTAARSRREEIAALVEAVKTELAKLRSNALSGEKLGRGRPVEQAVKFLSSCLNDTAPPSLFAAVEVYKEAVAGLEEEAGTRKRRSELTSAQTEKAERPSLFLLEALEEAAQHLVHQLRRFLAAYASSADADWAPAPLPSPHLPDGATQAASVSVAEMTQQLRVRVEAVSSLGIDWRNRFSKLSLCFYLVHGVDLLDRTPHGAPRRRAVSGRFERQFQDVAVFDDWLAFEQDLCTLPRESVLWAVLYGFDRAQPAAPAAQGTVRSRSAPRTLENPDPACFVTQLGWVHLPLFDHEGRLVQGPVLLPLSDSPQVRHFGPRSFLSQDGGAQKSPVLSLSFPDFPVPVVFPSAEEGNVDYRQSRNLEDLDEDLQAELRDLLGRGVEELSFAPSELERGGDRLSEDDAELLWEKRAYLRREPSALPLVLRASARIRVWDWSFLADAHRLVSLWTPLTPVTAVQLLLLHFPDQVVRRTAVRWVFAAPFDTLESFAPQLVEALRFELYEDSALAAALIAAAARHRGLAFRLFWELRQRDALGSAFGRRCRALLELLLSTLGRDFERETEAQVELVAELDGVAQGLKDLPKEHGLRMRLLSGTLSKLDGRLLSGSVRLPVWPGMEGSGVEVGASSYFPTNSLPLKVAFRTPNRRQPFSVLHKLGDDLRQDALVLQMMSLMNEIWLEGGLDLRVLLFHILPTGPNRGMVEIVENCSTLREIQVEMKGLTGAFEKSLVRNWLAKQNPSEYHYKLAVQNFRQSCAGWCVGTWVLGIGDRHNDNIMLSQQGHLFHIDFGKYLGDWQTVGGVRRDRTPFFLTPEMLFVINNGQTSATQDFQDFVDHACQALNLLRKRQRLIVNLLHLMVCSGMPGLDADAVGWVQQRLYLHLSDEEATSHFTQHIFQALSDVFTTVNNFVHTLAQSLAGNPGQGDSLDKLSFVEGLFSRDSDGPIARIQVLCSQKWRSEGQGKTYMYKISVEREGSQVGAVVFRSFKEVGELYRKLAAQFPQELERMAPLQTTLTTRNVRGVAERRRSEVAAFFQGLLLYCQEASASPLFYTFFHSILRDQSEEEQRMVAQPSLPGPSRPQGQAKGELKLSLTWRRLGGLGGTLSVLVSHARSLPDCPGTPSVAPDAYVKCYLRARMSGAAGAAGLVAQRQTKRKTRIVRRTHNPTFNDLLEYQHMGQGELEGLELEACVWHHASASQNSLLGGVRLGLAQLTNAPINSLTAWFPLQNLTQ